MDEDLKAQRDELDEFLSERSDWWPWNVAEALIEAGWRKSGLGDIGSQEHAAG